MSVHYNEGFKREVAIAYMAGQKQQLILLLNIIFLKPLFESGKYGEECQYKNTTLQKNGIDVAQEIIVKGKRK